MFTIKQVTNDSESLWEVNRVFLNKNQHSSTTSIGTLQVELVDGHEGSFDSGIVYVMNRDGRTVATYNFGQSLGLQNPPLDGLGNLA